MYHIAILCGGSSRERGISLNSARSLLDHLADANTTVHPFYVDQQKHFYTISTAQLYSNTPADFDFKLANTADQLSLIEVVQALSRMDMVFPVIHGAFGEDGVLQAILEKHDIPFVGSDSKTCGKMFDKYCAANILAENGYTTLPSQLIAREDMNYHCLIADFFTSHKLKRAVIKPVAGGSSIGVFSVNTVLEAVKRCKQLFEMKIGDRILLEPFCDGKEFTVIVLQNDDGQPVALIPSEIQVSYEQGGIFDYRRKYLPTSNTAWFCPPRFSNDLVAEIRKSAVDLFRLFGMRDFTRLDGWILRDQRIVFTDFNPISGMEQNSFIFQQASRIGLSHRDVLWHIIRCAGRRYQRTFKPLPLKTQLNARKVYVLLGGNTAERQISLMSGSNVWLKLRRLPQYDVQVYFLDPKGQIWSLPYSYTLSHTVEEVYSYCLVAASLHKRLKMMALEVLGQLQYTELLRQVEVLPHCLSFQAFLKQARSYGAFIFLALHGGQGENGEIQQKLEDAGLLYNGSDIKTSKLCIDKYVTAEIVKDMDDPRILSLSKRCIRAAQFDFMDEKMQYLFWENLVDEMGSQSLLIKPRCDGCSSGIVQLNSLDDLLCYIRLLKERITYIPAHTFQQQPEPVEMPNHHEDSTYIIEPFLVTDQIEIRGQRLTYRQQTGWVELTVGILEQGRVYHVLHPSITLVEGAVLSIEEKFQGGTGINLTPPPISILSDEMCTLLKEQIVKLARVFQIKSYARMDVFFNVQKGKLILIEINTLPALTPSTVLYQQALADNPSMQPAQFLEHIVESCCKASSPVLQT